ncbi:MAG: hypothetical protein IJH37_05845 [Clostridia bacterium]|nr:hypothetical protein [Clostridia bacterium]
MKKLISTISATAMVLIAAAPLANVAYANSSVNDSAYVFTVANNASSNTFRYRFVMLDTDSESEASRFFVIASANYGAGPIHKAGDNSFSWDPTDADTLSGYLNQTWFNLDGNAATTTVLPTGTGSSAAIYTLIPEVKSYIDQNHEWAMPGYDGLTAVEKTTMTCPITVLSRDEHETHKEKIGFVGDTAANHSNQNWLLRSPQKTDLSAGLYISKDTGNRGSASITGTYRFRPCFWLGVDFFKNVKLDLANTGEEVIETLKENYTRDELEAAGYTEDELNSIYVTVDDDLYMPVSAGGTAKPGYALTAEHDTPEAGVEATYQWQQADSENGTYTNISGATDAVFTLRNAQAGKYVRAQLRLTTDNGAVIGPATVSNAIFVGDALMPGAADNTNGGQEAINLTYLLTVAADDSGMGETVRSYFLLDDSGEGDAKFLLIEAAAVARLENNATQGMLYTDETQNNKFDPDLEGNLAYWLKHTYAEGDATASEPVSKILNQNSLVPAFIPYLDKEHEWLTEGCPASLTCPDDYVVKAPAAILSKAELLEYRDRFGWAEGLDWESGTADFEMLRTPRENNVKVRLIWRTNDNNGAAVGGGIIANSVDSGTGAMIRPVFWLSEDVFRNVKLDVKTMGDGVKEMLLDTYSKSELKPLYSESELAVIGYESVSVSDVSIQGIPAVGDTLSVDYKYSNSNAEAPESVNIEWLFSDTENGQYSIIPDAEGKTYTVGDEYINKYITVKVTPLDTHGNEGDPVVFSGARLIMPTNEVVVKSAELVKGDGSSVGKFIIKNNTADNRKVQLIIAAYNNEQNVMDAINIQETTIAPGEAEYSVSLEGYGDDDTVKTFVWNNLSEMIPLY